MKTIVDIVESFKKRSKTALIYKNDFRTFRWSYDRLYSYIRKFASFLEKNGVKPGDRVLLWGPNTPEWVIAGLGTMYYGAVLVPADMLSTPEAVDKIIENSKPKLIIKTKFRPSLKSKIKNFYLEELEYLIEDLEESKLIKKPKTGDLVELVYTSGTTGDPKGVMLTHYNIISNINSVFKRISITEKDSLLSLLPLSHMLEQMGGMLTPLSRGASIVYIRSLKPTSIFNALEEEDITVMICVPRILQSIKLGIKKKASESFSGKLLPKLISFAEKLPLEKRKFLFKKIHNKIGNSFRFFVSGGAPLDEDTENFWNLIGFKIVQGYGLTECSPVLTLGFEDKNKSRSVGLTLSGVQVKISSDGEIIARGPNIFQGYYKNEKKTKEAFRDGWFLTGDIGEFDDEGFLYIKGRQKNVIVTGSGVNVYPDDIEGILNNISGIKESCVVGVEGKQGEEIHAVLILEGKTKAKKLIDLANESLNSSQKIMSYTIWPEKEFPKTSTLKVKKNIVKEKISNKKFLESASQEFPRINLILSQISQVPPEKIKFSMKLASDLKIDSIGRVELVSAIEKEYNTDFEEELIDDRTTVKNLEKLIKERISGKNNSKIPEWNQNKIIRVIRNFAQDYIHIPICKFHWTLKPTGVEELEGLESPVLFVANHVSVGDKITVQSCLPRKLRYNLSAPMWAEFFYPKNKNPFEWILKKVLYFYIMIFHSIYPLSQEHSFTKSLRHAGKLMDKGENIIIYPEGERTRDKNLLPFKQGTAILIQNLRVPVVPIGTIGLEKVFPRDAAWPKKGDVRINFGRPIYFKNESRKEITERLRKEIESLKKMK